jgi:hypothetical protein
MRCRLVARAGALPPLVTMLQPDSSPSNLLWAARLLKAMAQQESSVLWEVCEAPGLLPLIPDILSRRPGQQQLERLIFEFRSRASATAAAAAAAAAAGGGSTAAAAAAAAADALNSSSSVADWDSAGGQGDEDEDAEAQAVEDLQKAQAHLAWLLAALASHPKTK